MMMFSSIFASVAAVVAFAVVLALSFWPNGPPHVWRVVNLIITTNTTKNMTMNLLPSLPTLMDLYTVLYVLDQFVVSFMIKPAIPVVAVITIVAVLAVASHAILPHQGPLIGDDDDDQWALYRWEDDVHRLPHVFCKPHQYGQSNVDDVMLRDRALRELGPSRLQRMIDNRQRLLSSSLTNPECRTRQPPCRLRVIVDMIVAAGATVLTTIWKATCTLFTTTIVQLMVFVAAMVSAIMAVGGPYGVLSSMSITIQCTSSSLQLLLFALVYAITVILASLILTTSNLFPAVDEEEEDACYICFMDDQRRSRQPGQGFGLERQRQCAVPPQPLPRDRRRRQGVVITPSSTRAVLSQATGPSPKTVTTTTITTTSNCGGTSTTRAPSRISTAGMASSVVGVGHWILSLPWFWRTVAIVVTSVVTSFLMSNTSAQVPGGSLVLWILFEGVLFRKVLVPYVMRQQMWQQRRPHAAPPQSAPRNPPRLSSAVRKRGNSKVSKVLHGRTFKSANGSRQVVCRRAAFDLMSMVGRGSRLDAGPSRRLFQQKKYATRVSSLCALLPPLVETDDLTDVTYTPVTSIRVDSSDSTLSPTLTVQSVVGTVLATSPPAVEVIPQTASLVVEAIRLTSPPVETIHANSLPVVEATLPTSPSAVETSAPTSPSVTDAPEGVDKETAPSLLLRPMVEHVLQSSTAPIASDDNVNKKRKRETMCLYSEGLGRPKKVLKSSNATCLFDVDDKTANITVMDALGTSSPVEDFGGYLGDASEDVGVSNGAGTDVVTDEPATTFPVDESTEADTLLLPGSTHQAEGRVAACCPHVDLQPSLADCMDSVHNSCNDEVVAVDQGSIPPIEVDKDLIRPEAKDSEIRQSQTRTLLEAKEATTSIDDDLLLSSGSVPPPISVGSSFSVDQERIPLETPRTLGPSVLLEGSPRSFLRSSSQVPLRRSPRLALKKQIDYSSLLQPSLPRPLCRSPSRVASKTLVHSQFGSTYTSGGVRRSCRINPLVCVL